MAIEKDSPTWRAVRDAMTAELEKARLDLEASMPMETSQFLRGRIHTLRAVLALGDTRPEIVMSDRVY